MAKKQSSKHTAQQKKSTTTGTAKKRSAPSSSDAQQKLVEVDINKIQVVNDPSIRLTWVDRMQFMQRPGANTVILNFESYLPDIGVRQVVGRFVSTEEHVRAMIDVMTKNLNYYPKPTPPPAPMPTIKVKSKVTKKKTK